MKIRAKITDGKTTWDEDFEQEMEDPKKFMVDMLKSFNSSLSGNEKPRKLVSVEVLDKGALGPHQWEKRNLTTVIGGGGNHDVMRCSQCGVTGKRFGLGQSGVSRDKKYKAKKYLDCNWMRGSR